MKFTLKKRNTKKVNRYNNKCYKPEIFRICDVSDSGEFKNIIIRGYTLQEYDKSKPVNINVKYGNLLLKEESFLINEINRQYRFNFKIGSLEEKRNKLNEIKKNINWKFRVLNDIYN